MKIVLDERERHLHEKLLSSNPPFLSTAVLPLGDVSVQTDLGKEIVLIERKTFADLLASIKDGRYNEQSYRLQHSSGIPSHNIIYVIEGIMSQLSPSEKKLVYSSMTSLNLFKGFSVMRTSSVQETADWLLALVDKLGRDIDKGKQIWAPYVGNPDENILTPIDYCSVVKKVKRENITPENICEIILCQIPGISSVTAAAITQKFPTLIDLICGLQNDPTCLDDLTTSATLGQKSRKINKTAVQNIKTYLLYDGGSTS